MKKLYFLPQWYLENKNFKRKRLLKIFISIFILADLILVEFLFININKEKTLEDELKQKIILQKNEKLQKNKAQTKNNQTLDTFLTLNKYIWENVDFKNLYIEGKRVDLNLKLEGVNYILFIQKIESINEFTVRQMSFLGGTNDSKININMELK